MPAACLVLQHYLQLGPDLDQQVYLGKAAVDRRYMITLPYFTFIEFLQVHVISPKAELLGRVLQSTIKLTVRKQEF